MQGRKESQAGGSACASGANPQHAHTTGSPLVFSGTGSGSEHVPIHLAQEAQGAKGWVCVCVRVCRRVCAGRGSTRWHETLAIRVKRSASPHPSAVDAVSRRKQVGATGGRRAPPEQLAADQAPLGTKLAVRSRGSWSDTAGNG